ncbi:MAG TPA: hypothetical protein VMZ71_10265, partial [Gemmataceae bacterium]|nr:hypothetical protein [Gemmataceae bacterium]
MSVSESVLSTEWVTLKHQGEDVAEAWVMPEGDGSTAVFLVPRTRLEVADGTDPVTVETLLAAARLS